MEQLAEKLWFKTIAVLIVLLVLLVALFYSFIFASWLTTTFLSLEKAVQTSLIAGGVAFGLALFTYWQERLRSVREDHREKKIEVYSRFFDMIFAILGKTINDESSEGYLDSSEFKLEMMEFKKDMLVYGSPKVIKAFNSFQHNSSGASPQQTLDSIGRMFLAIRKDIGLSNTRLKAGDIHSLYVTDYEEARNSK